MAKDHDASVLASIPKLAAEERALFRRDSLDDPDREGLAAVGAELDQCSDLLQQRRALREYRRTPAEARVRPPEAVKKHQGWRG